MAYATAADLAAALRIAVTPANSATLQGCVDAAAEEIDLDLDIVDPPAPLPNPAPAVVRQVNIARAVEWFKASDAAFGGVGYADIGILRTPTDGFARHSATILPYKAQWGIG